VHVENCEADGVPIARRSSGGGTVVIGPGTINATVVLRDDAAPGLGAVDLAQRFVLDRFAGPLRSVAPGIEILGLGDLTVAGRKFAGSAQRRLKRWFMVHITVLHNFPLDRISRYIGHPERAPGYRRGRSHEDFLMNFGATRKIVRDSLRQAWIPSSQDVMPVPTPCELVQALVREK
jgi:lipoate-protein ligase A